MDIMKWTYDDKTVRTAETADGKVLFCGKDVAEALGYTNPRDALAKHCKGVAKCDTLTNGGRQELSFIPESDVYRLAFGSKLPTEEVRQMNLEKGGEVDCEHTSGILKNTWAKFLRLSECLRTASDMKSSRIIISRN